MILRAQTTVSLRHSASDSDSDYGARSKKKKRPRIPADEIRVSSRGVKIPNYVDDVQDFEQFDDEDQEQAAASGQLLAKSAYGGVGAPADFQELDEIEAVLGHSRDENHEEDPEDNWYTNIVRLASFSVVLWY